MREVNGLDPLDNLRCGTAFHTRQYHDLSAIPFDKAALLLIDRINRVVAAFEISVRTHLLKRGHRCVLIEYSYIIDTFEGGHDEQAILLRHNRPRWPLNARDGLVAVEPQNKAVHLPSRLEKIPNVPRMQEVEAPVCPPNSFPTLLERTNQGDELIAGLMFSRDYVFLRFHRLSNGARCPRGKSGLPDSRHLTTCAGQCSWILRNASFCARPHPRLEVLDGFKRFRPEMDIVLMPGGLVSADHIVQQSVWGSGSKSVNNVGSIRPEVFVIGVDPIPCTLNRDC